MNQTINLKPIPMDTIKYKRKRMHHLLFKLGALETKTELLAGYKVNSTTELSEHTLDELIARLEKGVFNRHNAPANIRRQRSNVLTLLNKCGVYNTNNDWSDVNRFMLNPKISGKLLYELNEVELISLCKKLRSIATKRAKKEKNKVLNFSLN